MWASASIRSSKFGLEICGHRILLLVFAHDGWRHLFPWKTASYFSQEQRIFGHLHGAYYRGLYITKTMHRKICRLPAGR